MVDSGPKGARDTDDPLMQASAHERIKPFGQVAVAGEDNAALAIKTTAVAVAGAPAAAAALPTDGKSVFDTACSACHGTGIAGAPKIGDKAAWAPRIAQGHGDARSARDRRLYGIERDDAREGRPHRSAGRRGARCRRVHGGAKPLGRHRFGLAIEPPVTDRFRQFRDSDSLETCKVRNRAPDSQDPVAGAR